MSIRIGLAAAALLAAAACGSSLSAPRVAGSTGRAGPVAASPATQQTRAWLTFAACLRAHGAAVPDPTFDQDGNPQWPVNVKQQAAAALPACQADLQGLSSGRPGAPGPAAVDLAQETRFAQCIRQHGIPNFPDPNPQSAGFDLSNVPSKDSPAFQSAAQACRQLQPQGKPGS